MINLKHYLSQLKRTISHGGGPVNPEGGIQYYLGQNPYEPSPRPKILFCWYPPLMEQPRAERGRDYRGLRGWLSRFSKLK